MTNEDNETDEDIESEMEELEQEEIKAKVAKPVTKKQSATAQPKPSEMKERYVAIHQPEKIALVDTVKEEVITDEFKDMGTAQALARILNDNDRIMTAQGI